MIIKINNEVLETPSENMTLREMLAWRGVKEAGTAIAVNDRLVSRTLWDVEKLSENDNVTLISAAFGG
jgi:sulfur carrier protein